MKKVLTIAGSDCSGGAGVQADLKTIMAFGCYGMSAITALTAQNTTGVYGIEVCSPGFVKKQLDCIFTDIFPDAVKIGMVSSIEVIKAIIEKIKEYKPRNIVVDPVMVSTSGSQLLEHSAIEVLINELIPLATIITPNLFEAEILWGYKMKTKDDMINGAKKIAEKYKGSILVKGGHLEDKADDLLFAEGNLYWFEEEKIENTNTHGTGCTLSAAIACNLAKGLSLYDSIKASKRYISGALKSQLDLGKGNGPLDHSYRNCLWIK